MLLQRFIKSGTSRFAMTLALLILAGCGGSGPLKQDSASQRSSQPVTGPAMDTQEVPAAVMTLFEQATAVMAGGDFVDAELRFKEFLLQYPQYPGAHVNLAIIHRSNGNDVAARASVDAALAQQPDHAAALNQLGMLLRRNGNFLEAEAAYLKAVTVSPDYALAHYNLGVLNELYLQRLEAALRHFEIYQSLIGDDKQVAKWIKDLTRRVAANQRTANVAE
jgi:tetratricopeptide (TPR) repeat protein